MSRLKMNLTVLGKYCTARQALYGCWISEIVSDFKYVTDDGGRTLIPAEYWAELHGGYEYDELLQQIAGDSLSLILQRRKLQDEADQCMAVHGEAIESLESIG